MLTVRIIPCLDVNNGRVVKGVKFQGLRDAGSPSELAAAYEMQGADELVMLDVSATPEGRGTQVETIRDIRAHMALPLTVGGGVRSVEDADRLLSAGADKVSVNTAAVRQPDILKSLSKQFGRQCTVLAIDAARTSDSEPRWEVVVHSGKDRTGKDAIQWAQEAESLGVGEILLTSWDRDGTRSGYDLELLRALCSSVRVPVIASGGAANAVHMAEAFSVGADAVLAASIFHDAEYTVAQIKTELKAKGTRVRI